MQASSVRVTLKQKVVSGYTVRADGPCPTKLEVGRRCGEFDLWALCRLNGFVRLQAVLLLEGAHRRNIAPSEVA